MGNFSKSTYDCLIPPPLALYFVPGEYAYRRQVAELALMRLSLMLWGKITERKI